GQEGVNKLGCVLVVRQALPDDARSKVECEAADFSAKGDQCGLTLRLDLRGRRSGDAGGLCGRLLLQLAQDLGAVQARLLTDLARLGTSLLEKRVVLLKLLSCLCLGVLCPGDAALDDLGALIQQLLDRRKNLLPEDEEDDDEADGGPDDVVGRRNQRIRRRILSCSLNQCVKHGDSLLEDEVGRDT